MKQSVFNGRLLLRKILTGLSLGAVAITFQACYGMPMTEVSLNGTVSDGAEQRIEGIKVSADNNHGFTNSEGEYQFYVGEWEQTVLFEDIDGTENGWFENEEVKWKPGDGPLNVVLKRKQ